ncbi:hypothetical protein F5B22DRAFT_652697 [Xylaria bambusicola]|uniref:uncharacterized protein n=1 Tax=Xylaria bambusicola TaxID=326684 RepID=UPI0020086A78|nr:uncharacterized protein F5B22DRAFT_652697 [Xylaria bambusicola]KAI0502814.1 hypothetical protein F5B22DRAFT_652697 [Xylaria bambusicola]
MAISEDVPGIKVSVRVHQQPLPEFDDPDAHDRDDAAAHPLETKYIECVDDAHFDISYVVDSTYAWGYCNHVLIATSYIDGQYIRGHILYEKDTKFGGLAVGVVDGKEVCSSSGMWSKRRFRFAAVKTVEDQTSKLRIERDLQVVKGLGTIEVKFTRAIKSGNEYTRNHASGCTSATLELAEKSLKGKAVSHGTSYGVCEAIAAPRYVKTHDIPEDNGPILVFKFMYRSKDALRRELIIPRSPSRSPTLEDLTPAERDRLARERLNELREKKIKSEKKGPLIKREFNEVLDLTADPPVPRATKKSRLQDGREVDVIDLTDD